MKSMTAYGRGHLISKLGRWTLDIHSVNRKGLDLNLQLPSTLLFLDPDIRKWVGDVAQRGQITVRVSFEPLQMGASIDVLKGLKKKWETVAKALGYSPDAIDLRFVLDRFDPQMVQPEEKPLKTDLQKVWTAAVREWQAMKEKEGKTLGGDLEKRVQLIKAELKKVEKLQPTLQEKYRKKLQDRMKELQVSLDEDRMVREAAMMAEKGEIAEEITRLYSHLDQMMGFLHSKEKSIGRTLDFLAQEMGREIGTLVAKAGDSAISKVGIVIKSEIEKIREQVQNIE